MATIERPRNGRVAESAPIVEVDAPLYYEEGPKGVGWVTFSAIILGFAGVFGFIEGLLAISSSKVFTANATYVFSDLHAWGWIITIVSALTIVAAFSLLTGSELARWFGIAVASVNAMGQLMFVHANSWWAVCMFALDILVIYGLAAYAGSRLRTR